MKENETLDTMKLISLRAACQLLRGRSGRPPNVGTVRRWARHHEGCRPLGASGPVVVLRTVRMNGDILTLPEWVAAFERERLEIGTQGEAPKIVAGRTRAASIRRAEAALDKAGVK